MTPQWLDCIVNRESISHPATIGDTMRERPDIHEKVLNASSTRELMEIYDEWALAYEEDVAQTWGYHGPSVTVGTLIEFVDPESSAVLDAGCGTGLVGVLLQQAGFKQIDGIDYSEGMLEQARLKGAYEALEKMDMNQALTIASDRYDAVTCVGTFTGSHVRPQALKELVRITKPGGVLSCTVRSDYWHEANFSQLVSDLEAGGELKVERIEEYPYIISDESTCRLLLLRAC